MSEALAKVGVLFKRNMVNLNPDKTRYMLLMCKTDVKEIIR